MSKKTNIAIGTAIAAGVGYVAGVLTTPKSGNQTRKEIRRKASKAKSEAENKLKQTHSELAKLLDEANDKIKSGKSKAATEFKETIAIAESARQKTRIILSAIHEGETDDQELNKALKQTKQALTNLKKYIVKKT